MKPAIGSLAPHGRPAAERLSWYQNSVTYAIEVKSFKDSDGDGIGDFAGLTQSLDYLAGLGVTCLWLLPIYPTPNRDDGYDVADYYNVDPRLGTLGDFVIFLREANRRGMRVILDLVVNHTSDQHPWFQAARRDRNSPYRDYYIWTDEPPAVERRGKPVFPGEQVANWTYDSEAGAYYWHWFYHHQPDLNTGNPRVLEEIEKIVGFWLELGVSGFRVDAATFLIRRKGLAGTFPVDPAGFLEALREFVTDRQPDAILLAEADVAVEDLPVYLGQGDKMHLVFNFILNNHLFLALARGEAEPLERALKSLPPCPEGSHWANFIRNHDELNLDKLSTHEQAEVFEAFAPESSMRIYDRGIRRRLAPMLGGDQRRIELAYSLLFSMPGVPVLRYGQEIGMGEDLSLAGRSSVRTPMQWSSAPGAGFSSAPPELLVRPVIREGPFGYERVNVERQSGDEGSLLEFMKRLVRARKRAPELGVGDFRILDDTPAAVFAHTCEWDDGCLIAVHNLSDQPQAVRLDLDLDDAVELLDGPRTEAATSEEGTLSLAPYGYRWLRVRGAARRDRPMTEAVYPGDRNGSGPPTLLEHPGEEQT